MDTTAFDELGKEFHDFLLKQFAPPPGATDVLGFLGTGIAIDADSLLSGGEFNPARVNAWLDIVAEPLGSVIGDENRVESTSWTAYTLMEAICTQSMSVAPAGSDVLASFAKVKSQASEALGGATTVGTAPLDWYDPKHIPDWPRCSLSSTSTAAGGSSSSTTPPPTTPPIRAPLWAWRTLQHIKIDDTIHIAPTPPPTSPPTPPPGGFRSMSPVLREALLRDRTTVSMPATASATLVNHPVSIANVATPIRAFRLSDATMATITPDHAATMTSIDPSRFALIASLHDRPEIPTIARPGTSLPFLKITDRLRVDQAIMVSKEISTVANQASTSAMNSNSLTLGLSYLVVQLSRQPWWNDFLLLLDNWYIPGLQRGALVGESEAGKTIGVPIALILTSNVQIQSNWSASDRSSASTSTHVGPWSLNSSTFSAVSNTGQSTLTIGGTQAVACIYRTLPVLPPKSGPDAPPT